MSILNTRQFSEKGVIVAAIRIEPILECIDSSGLSNRPQRCSLPKEFHNSRDYVLLIRFAQVIVKRQAE